MITNLEKRNFKKRQRKLIIIGLEIMATRNDSYTLLVSEIEKKKNVDHLFSLSMGETSSGVDIKKHLPPTGLLFLKDDIESPSRRI